MSGKRVMMGRRAPPHRPTGTATTPIIRPPSPQFDAEELSEVWRDLFTRAGVTHQELIEKPIQRLIITTITGSATATTLPAVTTLETDTTVALIQSSMDTWRREHPRTNLRDPEGHILTRIPLASLESSYGGTYLCDLCEQEHGEPYHCARCSYDLCSQCAQKLFGQPVLVKTKMSLATGDPELSGRTDDGDGIEVVLDRIGVLIQACNECRQLLPVSRSNFEGSVRPQVFPVNSQEVTTAKLLVEFAEKVLAVSKKEIHTSEPFNNPGGIEDVLLAS
ncbi:hypothetical protein Pelo_16243 [Pelomyxa schiedti]|nr:hypothetical protein Pelo_16243 [Pelomyxa schiedti]